MLPEKFHGELVSFGVPEATSLAAATIMKSVPADSESYFATSLNSFADMMIWIQEDFEGRMAKESIQSELENDVEKSLYLDRLTENYYNYFRKYRQHAIESFPRLSQPPFVALFRSTGKLDSLKVESLSDDFPLDLSLQSDRFVESVWIAKSSDPEALMQDLIQTFEDFVAGMLEATDVKTTGKLQLTKKIQLSDTVSGIQFDMDSWKTWSWQWSKLKAT